MEFAVGAILALSACGLGVVAGFERDRAFYPVMMIVIASYYDLFAVIGGDGGVLGVEFAISLVFAGLAVLGFRVNLWLTVVGLLGHAILDFFHARVVTNSGLPAWWSNFCATFDAMAGLYLAWRLVQTDRRKRSAKFWHPHTQLCRCGAGSFASRGGGGRRIGRISSSRTRAHLGAAIDGAACPRAYRDAGMGRS